MKPAVRILAIVLGVVALGLAGAYLGLQSYLRSDNVRQQIQARLGQVLGGSLKTQSVDIGLGGSTLRDLELVDEHDQVWLRVGEVQSDLSLWSLARGESFPRRLQVERAVLTFRLDQNGWIVLPPLGTHGGGEAAEIPEVEVRDSQVVFAREGQTPVVVKQVAGKLTPGDNALVLTATGDSAELGPLDLHVRLARDFGQAELTLIAQREARVNQAVLQRLPYLPEAALREVQIHDLLVRAGTRLQVRRDQRRWHYDLQVDAAEARVTVPRLELPAERVAGQLRVVDNVAHLRAAGTAMDGTFGVEADYAFGPPVQMAHARSIRLENLDVRQVPQAWNIPTLVRRSMAQGRLYGEASLRWADAPADFAPAFGGALVPLAAAQSWLAALTLPAAYPAQAPGLQGQGKGQIRDPRGAREPVEFDWQLRTPGASRALSMHSTLQHALAMAGALLQAQVPAADDSGADLRFSLKNVDLAEMVKGLELDLPFPVAGTVSFEVEAALPRDNLGDAKAYKVKGTAQVQNLVVGEAKFDQVKSALLYRDGVLELTDLSATGPGGAAIQGGGRLELVPLGEVRLNLDVDRLPLDYLANQGAGKVRGVFSARLTAHGPAAKLGQLDQMTVRGRAVSDALELFGLAVTKTSFDLVVDKGVASIPNFQGEFEKRPLTARGSLKLREEQAFTLDANLQAWELAALNKVAKDLPPLRGQVTTSVQVRGTLNPMQFTASGQASARDVALDKFTTQAIAFNWHTDQGKLLVEDLAASLYEGKVTGRLELPYEAKAAGAAALELRQLNMTEVARDIRLPFRISGNIDGDVKGSLPPAREGERAVALSIALKAPKLRVQNLPTEELRGSVEVRQGMVDYKLQGKTLGGTFDLEGRVPTREAAPEPDAKPARGALKIHNVLLSQLAQAWGYAPGLTGRLDLELPYTQAGWTEMPEGRGELRFSEVRWKGARLSEDLRASLTLGGGLLRLRSAGVSLAEGTMDLQAAYHLREPERSWMSLALNNVEAAQLLTPWLDIPIEGPLQARVRGRLGHQWSGTADLSMTRGKIFGLEVTNARVPISWTYAPDQQRGSLDVFDALAYVAHGRVQGKASLASTGFSWRVEGGLRFHGVQMQELLRQVARNSGQLGGGLLTGRFDFRGSEVRSVNDLTGELIASFQQAQPLQIPVLTQVAPFVGLGPSTTFQQGEVRARLAGGIFQIQQLSAAGGNYRLFVTGRVSLQGALNLEVIAKTGDFGLPSVQIGPLTLRIPLVGPVPLVVLQEATNLLSNRVVYLQVTGTIGAPVVRPRPLPLLSQEAVRVLLDRAGLPITINP